MQQIQQIKIATLQGYQEIINNNPTYYTKLANLKDVHNKNTGGTSKNKVYQKHGVNSIT